MRLVVDIPERHFALVPHLVSLLQELEIEHVADIRVFCAPQFLMLVDHTHMHENLVALAAAVQVPLFAAEKEGHVLVVACATRAADDKHVPPVQPTTRSVPMAGTKT